MAKAEKGVALIARAQIVTGYEKNGQPKGYKTGDEFEIDAVNADALIKGGFAEAKADVEEAAAEANGLD